MVIYYEFVITYPTINSYLKELKQLSFNMEQKDGLFAAKIFAGILQIRFSC